MALYAALSFWLLVIMFTAWGVYELCIALIKPRIVNGVLLPGTLVAQLGHVLGLLVTGNTVSNTQLMGDDDEGKPKSSVPEKQRLPVIGPILVGLLPLVACSACLYVAAAYWGRHVVRNMVAANARLLPQTLPESWAAVPAGFWSLLHTGVDLAAAVFNGILRSDLTDWPNALFVYLAVCLTVRMAPFEGHRRGAIGAIFLGAILCGVLAWVIPDAGNFVESSWPILTFTVGMLLLLLLVLLVVTGLVRFVRILTTEE